MAGICAADNCERRAVARELCSMHASRMRRYGRLEKLPLGREQATRGLPGPCVACGRDLEPSEFYYRSSGPRLQPCKSCMAVRQSGKRPSPPNAELFWSRVEKGDGCWLWTGTLGNGGYGKFNGTVAHRTAYQLSGRELHDGLTLDHLCRVKHCVNPAHMEEVTLAENLRRAFVLTDACRAGHPFDTPNARYVRGGQRACRECDRRNARTYKARKRAAARGIA